MLLEVQQSDWSRVLAAPTNAQFFNQPPYKPVRDRAPSEDGVLPWMQQGSQGRPLFLLQPIAEATPGVTFSIRVTTWRPVGVKTPPGNRPSWVQSAGWEFLCTVGELGGLATGGGTGQEVGSDERFCRQVTLTDGDLNAGLYTGWVANMKAAAGVPAWLAVPVLGCRVVKVEFASGDPNAAVGMNALWAAG